ncbi:unnamed protein product [Bursaphelenchus okinawaensis]|uniref:Uncharacterized protein n=1 Tax=Bursaphelenchus okinawaensis TaxID=465554 RepID=A0A811LDD8_9BILA|nr:unnamed protein product [Bursaphelenchus okinawaensis]CAG9120432.1 unnamed protein product [Bursaphelenchus okinawaensis]
MSGFNHCILEEAGLLMVRNKANEHFGYNNIEVYDLQTPEKLYERSLDNRDDMWKGSSNFSIVNINTGEHIIYNPIEKKSLLEVCLLSVSGHT